MTLGHGSKAVAAAALGAALLTAGCSSIRDHQGYRIDEVVANAVQPGVDNRDSVAASLGRPSFVGQFNDREWYYVSRDTRQGALSTPRASEQTVLKVSFDEAGNVTGVQRTGMELIASISPSGEETPTLGRNRSFFEEIFGNVGAPTGQQGAGTADNPD